MIVGTWYGNSNPNMYYAKRSISLLLLLLSCQGPALWDPMDWKYHRAPCPSSSLGVFPSSSTLSQWCHPTISSSVVPFSSCLQSFPASWSFPMSWLFASGGQSIGTSSSESVLPMHIQSWFPLGLIWSPCSPKDSLKSRSVMPPALFFSLKIALLFKSFVVSYKL